MHKYNYSPINKKIKYYNENSKLFKKKKNRISIRKPLVFDSSNIKENDINFINIDNIRINNFKTNNNHSKIICKNNTQPTNFKNNNDKKIKSINEIDSIKEFGILDDFLNELEDNETIIKKKEEKPLVKDLKKLFKRNGYFEYFHISRTQQNNNSKIWNDFHPKREKC